MVAKKCGQLQPAQVEKTEAEEKMKEGAMANVAAAHHALETKRGLGAT